MGEVGKVFQSQYLKYLGLPDIAVEEWGNN